MIPGSNLLRQALSMIGSQSVTYYADAGRSTSATGRDITYFQEPVTIAEGSVQAVPRSRYEVLGLNFSRNYVTWFVPQNVIGLGRDVSGDQIEFNGRRYDIENMTNWFAQDGWVECLCVEKATNAR